MGNLDEDCRRNGELIYNELTQGDWTFGLQSDGSNSFPVSDLPGHSNPKRCPKPAANQQRRSLINYGTGDCN